MKKYLLTEQDVETILDFIKKYLREDERIFIEKHQNEIKVKFKPYNWNLNIQPYI